jgi:hypothetical protein
MSDSSVMVLPVPVGICAHNIGVNVMALNAVCNLQMHALCWQINCSLRVDRQLRTSAGALDARSMNSN